MEELKRKLKTGKDADRPILLLIWPEMFMSQYAQEFQTALRNYNEMFEVYYCRKEELVSDILNTRMMPKELVHMYIFDPKTLQPLEGQAEKSNSLDKNYIKKH